MLLSPSAWLCTTCEASSTRGLGEGSPIGGNVTTSRFFTVKFGACNPIFRQIDKKAWTDKKRPFRVVKADEKLIASREMPSKFYDRTKSQSQNRRYSPEPYTGIKDMTLTKKVEDHFQEELAAAND